MADTPTIQNRKARFEFQHPDIRGRNRATGTEVKSVRKGNVGLRTRSHL